MRYFSLFTGIGGFELGIQQAYEDKKNRLSKKRPKKLDSLQHKGNITDFNGSKSKRENKQSSRNIQSLDCIGYSEIDKYAIQIFKKHYPTIKNYGDCTKINVQELPEFEMLTGGFPCQSFSIAGKRGGFKDTRGTLFFEIARIAKAKRPRILFLENVKGLLSHNEGNTFATIISTIDELGYDCQWQVLNSKNFGVPQNRERVFIIGHLRGTSRPKVFPITETTESTIKVGARGKHQQDIVYRKDGIMTSLPAGTHGSAKHLTKIIDGSQGQRVYDSKGLSKTLSDGGGQGAKTGLYAIKSKIKNELEKEKTRWGRHFVKDDDIHPTLCAIGESDVGRYITDDMRIRRLTPTECERLQGFPDGWTEGLSDTQRYKTLGNAVTVNVIKAIAQRL